MSSYKSLRAWQVVHQLALEVGRVVRTFPTYERFELCSQLRRASLSVPCNLVEGQASFGRQQFLRYVRIAASSLAEVGYLLFYALESEYLSHADYERLDDLRRHGAVLISRLVLRLQSPAR